MKKVLIIFSVFFFFACTSSPDEDGILSKDRVVVIELLTTEPNYDEAVVTYYDYINDVYTTSPYVFPYDSDGQPLPLRIVLENYDFKHVSGEAYRNNHSTATLELNLYVNDELVQEDDSQGTVSRFATVKFDYTVKN